MTAPFCSLKIVLYVKVLNLSMYKVDLGSYLFPKSIVELHHPRPQKPEGRAGLWSGAGSISGMIRWCRKC